MAETESGLDMMRSRIKRASRKPPPPRRPAEEVAPVPAPPAREAAPLAGAALASSSRGKPIKNRPTVTLAPNAPAVNLAIRVRRPLDDRLVDIIHALRREDVRSSKVELIEMLLWELPEMPDAALRRRLSAFREAAPRGTGSPAEL